MVQKLFSTYKILSSRFNTNKQKQPRREEREKERERRKEGGKKVRRQGLLMKCS